MGIAKYLFDIHIVKVVGCTNVLDAKAVGSPSYRRYTVIAMCSVEKTLIPADTELQLNLVSEYIIQNNCQHKRK